MTFKLDPDTAKQIRTVLATHEPTIVEMAREIGVDLNTFFEGEDWSGLDLRPCDLSGMSFRDANLDDVVVYTDQAKMIQATKPKSMDRIAIHPRDSVKLSNSSNRQHSAIYAREIIVSFYRHIDNLFVAFFSQKLGDELIDNIRKSLIENYPGNFLTEEKFYEYSSYVIDSLDNLEENLSITNKKYPSRQDDAKIREMIIGEIDNFTNQLEQFCLNEDIEFIRSTNIYTMNNRTKMFLLDIVE